MNVRIVSAAFVALAVAACASPSSGQLAGIASNPSVLKPHAESRVDIQMVNEANVPIQFQTSWSYPASPFWISDFQKCVDPGTNWNTYIDYNHPSPWAMVVAYVRRDGCSGRANSGEGEKFRDILLKDGKGLIQVILRRKEENKFEFCWKQGGETKYDCRDFVRF